MIRKRQKTLRERLSAHYKTIASTVLILAGVASQQALAQTPEEQGLAIAIEAEKRDSGWKDASADLVMTLTNRHGESSKRELSIRILEVIGDGDKSLTTFHTPPDVRGTAFLSYTHVEGADDQWLYLPALKRVKRISSGNKSGPFMGSEFAYEDLTSQEIEKYHYRYLGDGTVNDLDCFIVERIPKDKRSGYTRQNVWFDKAEYRIQKIEFYDRKDSHLKTLIYLSYQSYFDKYWRADQMEMKNHQTGKATTLQWTDYSFRNGFSDRNFDKSTLKRAR